jgi:hypothetical protein
MKNKSFKRYNIYLLLYFILKYNKKIDYIDMGIIEDWVWTAATVYRRGKLLIPFTLKPIVINGIKGSTWGTPFIRIHLINGGAIDKECYL